MALRIVYDDGSSSSPSITIGGGLQSITDPVTSTTYSYKSEIVSFRTSYKKNVTQVPVPGLTMGTSDYTGKPASLIWDEGGISITHTVMFVESFEDKVAMRLRMLQILEFLNDVPIAQSCKAEFDELDWLVKTDASGNTYDYTKSVVISGYDITYETGTVYLIKGSIVLYEGRSLSW